MKIGINLKIDVSKIDKERLFKGKKGTYLDATAFIDLDNQGEFGDNGIINQAVSKEEREQGQRGDLIGNVTVFYKDESQTQAPQQAGNADGFDDDLGF